MFVEHTPEHNSLALLSISALAVGNISSFPYAVNRKQTSDSYSIPHVFAHELDIMQFSFKVNYVNNSIVALQLLGLYTSSAL